MTFTCTKCGNYSDDGDFEACICLRCIDNGAGKEQEQRKWHHIDAPPVRPLTPNEQKVYSLLRMGYTPKEVARQLHMPYGDEFFCNVHDVTCDTVRHLITSIREKGWEIPQENEEEGEDVQKYTDKQKEKAVELVDSGMAQAEVAKKLKISRQTISLWVVMRRKQEQFEQNIDEGSKAELAETVPEEFVVNKDKKEEPASAATDTDSMVESFGKESTDIIPENIPAVKGRYFSDDTCEAIVERLKLLYGELDEISMQMIKKIEAIKKINASIDELDSVACGIQFRIQELEADLVVIAGGVVNE